LEISGDGGDDVILDTSAGAWTNNGSAGGFDSYTATDGSGNTATILIETDIDTTVS